MKKNLYITFAILCFLGLFLINVSLQPVVTHKPVELKFNEKALASHPEKVFFAAFALLLYLSLLIAGIFTLAEFIAKIVQKKGEIAVNGRAKSFYLSEEKAAKLIFILLLFILTMNVAELTAPQYLVKKKLLFLGITMNLLLEVGVIVIIISFVKYTLFFSKPKKGNLALAFKNYTAILPLILIAFVVSNFMLNKLGIKPSVNTAVEVLLALKNRALILLLAFQIIVFAPIAEELFFRGILYRLVNSRYPFFISAIFVSVCFSFLHRTPSDILPLFIISFALCYLYEKTQDITTPIVFHAIFNTVNLLLLLAAKNLLQASA